MKLTWEIEPIGDDRFRLVLRLDDGTEVRSPETFATKAAAKAHAGKIANKLRAIVAQLGEIADDPSLRGEIDLL